MSYHNVLSFRVGNELHADLLALVAKRGTDVGKLIRSLIYRELRGGIDQALEQYEMTVFLAIAMDGLLLAHPDPQLRPKLIKLWQERMAEERPNAR